MAKVVFTITDAQDENGRHYVNIEATSDDAENRASMANIVAIYMADKWDDVTAAARGYALKAFAEAMKTAGSSPTQH